MKKYSKKWRVAATILLFLFLLGLVGVVFSSCDHPKENPPKDTWVLIRLPDGNTIHTKVVSYTIYSSSVWIYTENRQYVAGINNVCFIQDIR